MTVLVITHSHDNDCIPKVMHAIDAQGGTAFRFNTDQFPTEVKLDLSCGRDAEQGRLISEQGSLDLEDITAVWYRRIRIGQQIPSTMDAQLRHASVQESRRTINGMLASLNAFHLDPVVNIRRAEHKQLQLQIAHELELDIPRTLTTNNPVTVREFAQTCEQGVITKMLTSFVIYEAGEEKVVYTNPVSEVDLANLDGLQFCPMTFQENIPKALELRITIVGRKVFAAAVDSQKLEQSHHDWRRQGVALLYDWQPYTLPPDIQQKLLMLMDRLHLNYGAADMILTPDNRHVFLEVNPCGEFFWLDLLPDLPISDAIAKLLLSPSHKGQRLCRKN
ncbi:MAG: MvdD family ATP-grasp ribosomal peptide maturase [Leptolyngbya sp. SIO1E4]|nr:MvdD family ATP-grasp ribosomal peptide maturase [Leptolyngbya sp. SIO1E4]